MTSLETALTVLGALLVAGALVSGLARRSFLSLTAVFVLVGVLLGEGGLEVLRFEATGDHFRLSPGLPERNSIFEFADDRQKFAVPIGQHLAFAGIRGERHPIFRILLFHRELEAVGHHS